MKSKLCVLLLLLCVCFSVFSGTCLADKDYSPYVIEVKVSAGDTVSNLCDSRRIDYYAVRDAILIVNGFASESALSAVSPGQTIYLPRSKAAADSIVALYNSTVSATIPASYVETVTVQQGDTLYSICAEHGLTYNTCQEAIKKLNLWSSDYRLSSIYAGQEILIPSSDEATAAIMAAVSESAAAESGIDASSEDHFEYYLAAHTVAAGETIQSVCSQLGILYSAEVDEMLRAINNLDASGSLPVGSSCLVPSKTASGASYMVYSHKVVFGDTIENLCEKYAVRYADSRRLLQGLNPGAALNALRVGEEILLISPAPVSAPASASSAQTSSSAAIPVSPSTPYPAATSYPAASYPASSYPAASYPATFNAVSPEAEPEIVITVK